jgi:hypothetical protein
MNELTWQQVAGAFSRRYETKRGMAWHYGPHVQHLTDIAEWVNLQKGDRKEIAKRLLDNWFDTRWAMKVDYKPKFLAENLGSVYNPVAVPIEEEPNEDAINARRLKERRQQEQRELEKKFAADVQEAVPPPESLEAMMARIGKTLK